MHTFFAAEPQPFFDDVLLLPQAEATTGPTGRPPNSYAVLFEDRSVLFDAPFRRLLPALQRLADDGYPPAALVVSHRHVVGQGDGFEAIQDAFGCPLFLHPTDARHPSVREAGLDFENPMAHDLLTGAGLETLHVPCHTAGSVMLYTERHGGVVLAGDSAVGPGPKQPEGARRLERPPTISDDADAQLRALWKDWDRPLSAVLPLHGQTYLQADLPNEDLRAVMRPLWEEEAMTNQ